MYIATSQPTYLPWPGYFGLMQMCKKFIILDDIQFSRRSWQQRNIIKTANGSSYLSLSIKNKGLRNQKINETLLSYPEKDFKKHKTAIIQNYRNTDFFEKYKGPILNKFNQTSINLFEINFSFILTIKELLQIDTELILSSSLNKRGTKEDLIYSLLDNFNINKCIINPGSQNYMKKNNSKYEIYRFNYNCSNRYKQAYDGFDPYVSIIDMLFNIGSKNAKDHLKKCSKLEKIK